MGVSPVHGDFGTALTLVAGHAPGESPSVLLEGCQSITAEYWQCDYRAEWLWMREVQTLSAVGHVLHVLPRWLFGDSDNVLDVLSCSTAVLELWGCSDAPIQGGGDGSRCRLRTIPARSFSSTQSRARRL